MALVAGYIPQATTGITNTKTVTQANVTGITPQAGDTLFLVAIQKHTATPADPAVSGGIALVAASTLVGAGNLIRIGCYQMTLTGATFSVGFTAVTGAVITAAGAVGRAGSASEVLTTAWSVGNDAASGTGFSATGAGFDILTGDTMLALGMGTVNNTVAPATVTCLNTTLAARTLMGEFAESAAGGYGFSFGRNAVTAHTAAVPKEPRFSTAVGASRTGGAGFLRIRSANPVVVRSGSVTGSPITAANQSVLSPILRSGSVVAGAPDASRVGVSRTRPPGLVLPLGRWKLTLPTGPSPGNPDSVAPPELITYQDANTFETNGNAGVFIAPVQGISTSVSSGATRNESRELTASGEEASWGLADVQDRQLTVTMYPDPTGSTDRKEMTVFQIHGGTNAPPLYFAAEYHVATPRLRMFKDSVGIGNILPGPLSVTSPITIRVRINNGTITVFAAKGEVASLPATPQYTYQYTDFADPFHYDANCYFKWGAYNKSAIATGGTGDVRNTVTMVDLVAPSEVSFRRSGTPTGSGTLAGSQAVTTPVAIARTGSVLLAEGVAAGSQAVTPPAVLTRSGSAVGSGAAAGSQSIATVPAAVRSGSAIGEGSVAGSRVVEQGNNRSGDVTGSGAVAANQAATSPATYPRSGATVAEGAPGAARTVTQPVSPTRSGQSTGEGVLAAARVVTTAPVFTRSGSDVGSGVLGANQETATPTALSRNGGPEGSGVVAGSQTTTTVPAVARSGSVVATGVGSASQRSWVPRAGSVLGYGTLAASQVVGLPASVIRSGNGVTGSGALAGAQRSWVLRIGSVAGTGVLMGAEVTILPPSYPRVSVPVLGTGRLGGSFEIDVDTRFLPRVVMPRRRQTVRWLAQDIITRSWVSTDLAVRNPSVTMELSAPATLEFSLDAGVLARLNMKPWGTFIHVETDGAIRSSGMLMPWSWGGGDVKLTARGVTAYPTGMPYGATSTMAGDSGLIGVGLDPLDVVRHIWSHLQSQPDGDLGVVLDPTKSLVRIGTATDETQGDVVDPNTGAAAPQVISNDPLDPRLSRIRTLAQKISADAAVLQADLSLPGDTLALIRLDADFIISQAGQAISEDPGRYGSGKIATLDTHRDGPYSALNWWENTDCGQEIGNLAKDAPFDYLEAPTWSGDGQDVVQRVRLGWPRLGRQPAGVEFTEGVNLTQALTPVERDDDYASEIIVLGKGEGPTMVRGTAGVPRNGRLRRAFVLQDSGISTGDGASRRAELERLRKQGLTSFDSAKVRLTHSASRLGSFRPGDDVPVRCSVEGLGDVSILHRVKSIQWVPGTDYADVKMARSDTFRYGGGEL